MASSSVILNTGTYETLQVDLNSPIEKIQDYKNIDLEPFEKSPIWSDDYLLKLNIQRRPFNFQIELIQSVIKNENSIICLRTGAGKTYIGALLIKYNYLKKKKEKSDEFLSFFLIPNRSIREQQVKAIRDVGDLRVIGCDDNSTVNQLIHYNHVIVCTPQKFLNSLLDKTIDLNSIDLIVFDECHHCIGKHPYSKIMEQYLIYNKLKFKPKILGLTASCGTKLTNPKAILEELLNETERKENALGKLYELCATLNCYDIAIILNDRHIEELNNSIPRPTDDKILLIQYIPFNQYLYKLKEEFQSLLTYIGSKCLPVIPLITDEQKLIEHKKEAETTNNFINVILINYMIMFVKRFNALTDLPLKSIMNDIIKKLDLFYKKKETPIEIETDIYNFCIKKIKDLNEQAQQSQYYLTNPKLDHLTDRLKLLIEQRQNTRGLVLVSRTLYAKLMYDYFKEREDIKNIIKPCWLVGQSGVDYQNSLSQQDETLKDFRKGLSNVMIATDIVQEGLDVPECSFVIRYEFVSNEIGTVQSRGRARAEQSSCFLIVDTDSINYGKEMKNRLKVKEMEEALTKWKQTSVDELKQNICNVQNRIIEEWLQEAKQQELMRAYLKDSTMINGKVSCRSCDYYLGEISWIRKRNNNYFVRKQEFFDRVEIERYPDSQIFHEIQLNGKVRCGDKKCRQDLGGIQLFLDRPDVKEMCALQCKQLKFSIKKEDDKYEISLCKKWSEVKFQIYELEPIKSNDKVIIQD